MQSPGFRNGREAKKERRRGREEEKEVEGAAEAKRISDPRKSAGLDHVLRPGANFTSRRRRRVRSDGQVSAGRNYIKRGKERHRGREGPEERGRKRERKKEKESRMRGMAGGWADGRTNVNAFLRMHSPVRGAARSASASECAAHV